MKIRQSTLKGQDIVVLLKIANRPAGWTFQSLSKQLGMSASEVHGSLRRAEAARLFNSQSRKVSIHALCQVLEFGVPYFLPAERMARSRGIPTAYSAEPLRSSLLVGEDDIVVWPDANGDVLGEAISPLYKSVPIAVKNDQMLHQRLALVDAIRIGKARDRKLASSALRTALGA